MCGAISIQLSVGVVITNFECINVFGTALTTTGAAEYAACTRFVYHVLLSILRFVSEAREDMEQYDKTE